MRYKSYSDGEESENKAKNTARVRKLLCLLNELIESLGESF